MSALLQDRFTSVLDVKTPGELLNESLRFCTHLEFETACAMAVVDHIGAASDFFAIDNASPAADREFGGKIEIGRRDPVMQHCKRDSAPIAWNQDTYTAVGQGELWEALAGYGYRSGVALAIHMPGGRHFFVAVDRDRPLPACAAEVTRVVADLQLFAVLAQDVAMRVLVRTSTPADPPRLTPRELESLRWTMEGKTAWEVGRILGISEQTAVRHVNNATHKLGCVNKHHAVVKALRFGLIQ